LPKGKVFELKKSLYGIKQGAMRWWKVLSGFLLTSLGFTQCVADPCLFYLVISPSCFAIISVYVDDLLLCTTDVDLKDRITEKLHGEFKITDEGDFTWSLGMHITTSADRHTITIDMARYCITIIKKFGFDTLPPIDIPMDPAVRFSDTQSPLTEEARTAMLDYPYREALGSLMFLMVVFRLDIAFPTVSLARYSHNPSLGMWKALVKVYRYLKATTDLTLTYSRMSDDRNPLMIAYTDADWSSNDIDFRRSVIGYVVFLAGAAVSWMSKFNRTGLSSCEVEYYGMGAVACDVVSHTHLLNELAPLMMQYNSEVTQSDKVEPVTLHCDNSSARQISLHPHMHKRTKHIHIRHHVLRQFVEWHIIRFQLCTGPDNVADMMVKALKKSDLRKHRTTAYGPFSAPNTKYAPEELLRQKTNATV